MADETPTSVDAQVADLGHMIGEQQVVAIVGTGVSLASTGSAQAASWKGLLERGIDHAVRFAGRSPRWRERQKQALDDAVDEGDLFEMLNVAEQVSTRLAAPDGGEYIRWLRESLSPEKLPITDESVIRALADLHVPIITTNYDELIEQVTGLPGVTWKDKHKVARIVRGDDRAVLHLHGKWDVPDSVVLGICDYAEVRGSEHTRAVMQCLGFANSLLFVGCGEGLNDPNFHSFLQWLGCVRASDEYRNFRLALRSEVADLQKQHPPEQRIFVLPFGDRYDELSTFLRALKPESAAAAAKPHIQSALSPALSDYIEYLCEHHATLPLIGISTGLKIELPIREAYVPLRTCSTLRGDRGRFDVHAFQQAEAIERNVPLEEMFGLAWRNSRRGVLLLGDPGAGKTTAARQICWQLATGEVTAADLGLPNCALPVFVRLRNVRSTDLAAGLQSFVDREIQSTADDGLHPAAELGKFTGSLLWLFDGLDEVVDEATRVGVAGWLADLLSDRSGDRVLVTARYQGIEDKVEMSEDFLRFEVQPLDDGQTADFVHTWFRVAYQRLGRDREEAGSKSRALLRLLHEPAYRIGNMAELRSNPLMLTVLCLVYHEDDSLPRSRVRLYERCVRVLLETWRQQVHTQHGGRPYNPDAARQVLATVAWWMHEEVDRRSVPLAEIEQCASDELRLYPNSGLGGDGREFIRLMCEDSGILAASGSGSAEFLHLTFQEYLAALYAVDHEQGESLARHAEQSWWQEVILLALAQATQAFSQSFFETLLKGTAFDRQGDFVERCLQEAEPLVPAPFVRQLRSAKVPQRRKVALLRHLKTFAFPELLDVCREWLTNKNEELASLSREILDRAGQLAAEYKVEREWLDPRTGITFVRIPAGSFDMGDAEFEHCQPIHRVTITRDFWLGKYPVTNEEYGKFLAATGHREPEEWNNRRFNQTRQPVVGVSWDDAQAFCDWAGCRLPTEAEWEYACRAGSSTAYSFGDKQADLDQYAWYAANSNQTQVVGGKRPNAWDLYDMHGNVWEWCADGYGGYTAEAATDPRGPEQATGRVIRGGGWNGTAEGCRSASRYRFGPAIRSSVLGFRVAAVPSSQPVEVDQGAESGM